MEKERLAEIENVFKGYTLNIIVDNYLENNWLDNELKQPLTIIASKYLMGMKLLHFITEKDYLEIINSNDLIREFADIIRKNFNHFTKEYISRDQI